MSESYCQVIELGKIGSHPNADLLEITQVMNAYPCIVKKGDFKEGEKAVYISVDMLVPTKDPRFSFLTENEDKEFVRIKAKKLRGIFSMGLLIKAEESWELGQDVREFLGVKKYEPDAHFVLQGENESDKSGMPVYTDIEGFRKYKNLFDEGEEVVITEKLHGCLHKNSLILLEDGREVFIKNIQVGDRVLTLNEQTKVFEVKNVKNVLIQKKTNKLRWFKFILENGRELVVTEDHPILTKNRGWIEAKDLTINDELTGV